MPRQELPEVCRVILLVNPRGRDIVLEFIELRPGGIAVGSTLRAAD